MIPTRIMMIPIGTALIPTGITTIPIGITMIPIGIVTAPVGIALILLVIGLIKPRQAAISTAYLPFFAAFTFISLPFCEKVFEFRPVWAYAAERFNLHAVIPCKLQIGLPFPPGGSRCQKRNLI